MRWRNTTSTFMVAALAAVLGCDEPSGTTCDGTGPCSDTTAPATPMVPAAPMTPVPMTPVAGAAPPPTTTPGPMPAPQPATPAPMPAPQPATPAPMPAPQPPSNTCPTERPVSCPDGLTCVVVADDCPAVTTTGCPAQNSCAPCPDDTGVFSCRYANGFDNGNEACVDFPAAQGWDADSALLECLGIVGAAAPMVTSEPYNSCLVQHGGIQAMTRCTFSGSQGDYFAYEIPSIGCGFGGGVFEESGPYCLSYQ